MDSAVNANTTNFTSLNLNVTTFMTVANNATLNLSGGTSDLPSNVCRGSLLWGKPSVRLGRGRVACLRALAIDQFATQPGGVTSIGASAEWIVEGISPILPRMSSLISDGFNCMVFSSRIRRRCAE